MSATAKTFAIVMGSHSTSSPSTSLASPSSGSCPTASSSSTPSFPRLTLDSTSPPQPVVVLADQPQLNTLMKNSEIKAICKIWVNRGMLTEKAVDMMNQCAADVQQQLKQRVTLHDITAFLLEEQRRARLHDKTREGLNVALAWAVRNPNPSPNSPEQWFSMDSRVNSQRISGAAVSKSNKTTSKAPARKKRKATTLEILEKEAEGFRKIPRYNTRLQRRRGFVA